MNRVIFHASIRIAAFTASDGREIPALIPGDNFEMDERDSRHLQQEGAGIIITVTIPNRATFQRASEIGGNKE